MNEIGITLKKKGESVVVFRVCNGSSMQYANPPEMAAVGRARVVRRFPHSR